MSNAVGRFAPTTSDRDGSIVSRSLLARGLQSLKRASVPNWRQNGPDRCTAAPTGVVCSLDAAFACVELSHSKRLRPGVENDSKRHAATLPGDLRLRRRVPTRPDPRELMLPRGLTASYAFAAYSAGLRTAPGLWRALCQVP